MGEEPQVLWRHVVEASRSTSSITIEFGPNTILGIFLCLSYDVKQLMNLGLGRDVGPYLRLTSSRDDAIQFLDAKSLAESYSVPDFKLLARKKK